jgi:hypothetical protein
MSADVLLCRPTSYDEVADCLIHARKNGLQVCPKGSGLSFGDVALLSNKIVLDISNLNRVLSFDEDSGTIRVQSGIHTVEILKYLVPYRRSLTGLTGSKGNTVAGNISNDVNGKDAWKYGSFCNNVLAMKVMMADLQVLEVSREIEPELFNAICGGLGLIAIVLEVTLRSVEVSSFNVRIKSQKSCDLFSTIALLEHASENADFAYCWADTSAHGKKTGRSLCESATYLSESDSDKTKAIQNGFEIKKPFGVFGPRTFWWGMRTFYSNKAHQGVSRIKYLLAPDQSVKQVAYTTFQYPMLRWFSDWNLFFYPHGFREAQLLFSPQNFHSAYTEILEFCHSKGISPWICGIKKHRAESGLLTFGGDGYSFTLNYSLKGRSASEIEFLESSIVGLTIRHQGKCYLGKFPFANSSDVSAMYPQFSEYTAIKTKRDPERLLWSNAAERLIRNL